MIIDLDPDQDDRRIKQLKDIDTQVTDKFKTNDKAVKDKMVSLIAAAETSTTKTAKAKEEKAAEEKKEKFEIRMKNHLKKTKVLKETILLLPECQDMSEQGKMIKKLNARMDGKCFCVVLLQRSQFTAAVSGNTPCNWASWRIASIFSAYSPLLSR